MRKLLIAAAFVAALFVDMRPAPAAEMPWCGVYETGRGSVYWNCRFRSNEDCIPDTVYGNRGFCVQNPAYGWTAGPAQKPRRKAKRG